MITLIGHGYVGKHIKKELEYQKIDHQWISHCERIPAATTVIINAAGYTGSPNVDACEIYKQETINGNVIFPIQLEETNKNIPIVHITSGCVYTGYKDNGWTEDDTPNFTFNNGSFYSGSKALLQTLMTPYYDKSYLLRLECHLVMIMILKIFSQNFLITKNLLTMKIHLVMWLMWPR